MEKNRFFLRKFDNDGLTSVFCFPLFDRTTINFGESLSFFAIIFLFNKNNYYFIELLNSVPS